MLLCRKAELGVLRSAQQASAGHCDGLLWCQLIQMLHWNSTHSDQPVLSVATEEATASFPDEAACSSPVHSPRGMAPCTHKSIRRVHQVSTASAFDAMLCRH